MAATARVLFASSLVKLLDYTCDTPRSGCGCERCDPQPAITIIRRGVHAYHARSEVALAEPGLTLLYRGDEAYRLSHPYERDMPDRSTCVEPTPALHDEAFGERPLARDLGTRLSPETQVLELKVRTALRQDDRLASEERVVALIHAVAQDFRLARPDAARPAAVARRVDRARAFIAATPETNHGLAEVAAAAATSPFHLARLFKRHTGMTLRAYRLRLRLARVIEELADGATDLSTLAVRAGFADHSHMANAFRRTFGMTPSALRDALGAPGLRQESKILQAMAHRAA